MQTDWGGVFSDGDAVPICCGEARDEHEREAVNLAQPLFSDRKNEVVDQSVRN